MINVNSKKTMKKLSQSIYKQNKMRNAFAIVAIILTTTLFCILFFIAQSLNASLEETNMRMVGGSAHGGFKNLSMEEYEKLSKHPLIKEMTYDVVLSIAENKELRKRQTEIRYAKDDLVAKLSFAFPDTGRMPKEGKELATDTLVLKELGIPAKLGEKVTISYSVGKKSYTDEFTLVGIWTGDVLSSASQMWLSKDYVNQIFQENNLDDKSENNPEIFEGIAKIQAEVNFSNSWNIEKKLQRVITESGYSLKEIDYGTNWAYAGGKSIQITGILGVGMLALIIVFCGYLMIANVFLISIHNDIRFYGLLRTIGTTKRQLQKILQKQAMFLALLGIPAGLIIGLLLGNKLVFSILGLVNMNVKKVSFSPFIFLFSILFSLLTVFISMKKAGKLASSVSPIEAIRNNENSNTKKDIRKGTTVGIWQMAWHNVGRNKKRVIFVVASLSLSMIILNGAYTLADSFDAEEYVSDMITHDFVIGDATWFHGYMGYEENDTLNDDFLQNLQSMTGVEALENIYFTERQIQVDAFWDNFPQKAEEILNVSGSWLEYIKEDYESEIVSCHVYGLDDMIWQELKLFEGTIDIDKLKSGRYAVVGACDTEGKLCIYHVGDTVTVSEWNEEKGAYDMQSYEVIAVADIPYAISVQHSHPLEQDVFLSSETFLSQISDTAPMITTLDVQDVNQVQMESFLMNYCKNGDMNMDYKSRASIMKECETTKNTFRMVGLTAGILLALIGIANFSNTILTSMLARKRELALLQAVGMTGRQQKKMLMAEGILYLIFMTVTITTLGNFLIYIGLRAMFGTDGYFQVHPTIIPSAICYPIFLLLILTITALGQKALCKKSVVDRLRDI